MDIEQVLPHVLRCIDTSRLGPRKVAMLELVYIQQAGRPNMVPLGDKELRRLTGRSPNQVSYDRRALDGLVKLGMLRKVSGRGAIANAYSLREPKLWDAKKVRFLGPRERIVSFFWALTPRGLFDLSRDDAGQTVFFRAMGVAVLPDLPRDTAGQGPVIARVERAAPESHRAANPALDAQPEPTDRADSSRPQSAADTVPMASKEALVKDALLKEGQRDDLEPDVRAIGRRIAVRCNLPWKRLTGEPLRIVREVVTRYEEHLNDLYTLAVTLPEYRVPEQAALGFVDLVEGAAGAGWPHPRATQIAALERKIRTYEEVGAGADVLAGYYEELAALRSGIAV